MLDFVNEFSYIGEANISKMTVPDKVQKLSTYEQQYIQNTTYKTTLSNMNLT